MNKSFSVKLINQTKQLNQTIQVTDEEYILDVAEMQEIDLPYSCRAGSCFSCLGKVVEGRVEQSEQALKILKPDEIDQGYILTCAAYAASDCTILTHQEEEFF